MKQILDYVQNSEKLTSIQKEIFLSLFPDMISFIADGDEVTTLGKTTPSASFIELGFISDGTVVNKHLYLTVNDAKNSLYRPTEGFILGFSFCLYRLYDYLFVDVFPNGEVWTHDGYTAVLRFNGKDGPPGKDFWGELEKVKNFMV